MYLELAKLDFTLLSVTVSDEAFDFQLQNIFRFERQHSKPMFEA